MSELIVVVGPIASGKSTVADALAGRLRSDGQVVAVLDFDDVVGAIGGFTSVTARGFEQALVVFGELVGAWLRQDLFVIAHGPFFAREEDEALLHAVPSGIKPRRVELLATYEIALERVGLDRDRVLSKDPEVLRLAYDRAASLRPAMPPSEFVFDTSSMSCEEIADSLVASLLQARP